MNTTTTMDLQAGQNPARPFSPPAWAEWIAARLYRLQWLVSAVRMPAPTVPEASLELLRLADAYEATQPSYAADLRAAALQSMGERRID